MQNFLDKCKTFFAKIGAKILGLLPEEKRAKVSEFFQKYKRFFYAAILFIVLIIVLVSCTGDKAKKGKKDGTESGAESFNFDAEFEVDEYSEINDLITNYFTAYAQVDMESLSSYAYPISDNEASYIAVFADYVESYNNISCYTMHGASDGAYFVSAYYEIKFKDIDTMSPALDFFYVEKDEDGNYYINNLYRPYYYDHTADRETEVDENLNSLVLEYAKQQAVIDLQTKVNTSYNETIASDENLHTMITTTLPAAIRLWADASVAESTETEGLEGTEADTSVEETQVAEETPQEETPQEETPATVTVKVTMNDVNVRGSASTDGEKLGKASKGDTYTKTGEKDGWVQIDYNGKTGYVSADYVTEVSQTTEETPQEETTATVTVKVTMNDVNVRGSASTDGEKLGKASKGDTYTKTGEKDGWVQIDYNGTTGYISADYVTEVSQ